MSFLNFALITSRVNVELDVRTKDESVDMDAASTNTITIAIITDGSVDNIAGTIVSNIGLPVLGSYVILSA
jgi:hypothetical protein